MSMKSAKSQVYRLCRHFANSTDDMVNVYSERNELSQRIYSMTKWSVMIAGAGKIGQMLAVLLNEASNYNVVVADANESALSIIAAKGIAVKNIDLSDEGAVTKALQGVDAIICATPYFLNHIIAKAAKESRTHYFDLTEDIEQSRNVLALAQDAESALMPQCGLAPGFVGIVGYNLARQFEKLDVLSLRVGALPLYPTNALKYNMTWSTDGLINEYCNPCDVIDAHKKTQVQPLANLEHFSIDGVEYECFNTSGGLGTLSDALEGKARSVTYRTIRYPGHRDIIKLLLHDLGLIKRRDLMKDVLDTALPMTKQDVVVIFCTASGMRNGVYEELSYLNKPKSRVIAGETWGAIQVTTAAGVTGVMDLMRQGKLPTKGFVSQEQVKLEDFLATPFGALYQEDGAAGFEHAA